jgi:hypothetical protein
MVHISGAAVPGGRITVRFLPDGAEQVAADAGDYIYPADVRLDGSGDVLYIKASGSRAVGGRETWLFEYDLQKREQVTRVLVDPTVLPEQCPESR